MLLDDFVEVKINGYNVKYYKNLGYDIPTRIGHKNKAVLDIGNTIIVSIKDLQMHSNIKVSVECDCCKDKYKITYGEYNRRKNKNKIYCKKCCSKIYLSKEQNPNWNPNKTDEEREIERSYPEYKEFVKRVLARDNYICQCCGKKTSDGVEVHHLDGYNWCKEKRTDETNGITLCKMCHSNFHALYGIGNNTKEQFEEWVGYAIGELKKYDGILSATRRVYCIEDEKIYDSVMSLQRELGLKSYENIYDVCNHTFGYHVDKNGEKQKYSKNTIKGKHYLWLDEFLSMNLEDVYEHLEKFPSCKRKVLCKNTNEIFDSIKCASDFYNTTPSHISSCCRGKRKSAGKHPYTKESLKWEYYNELNKYLFDIKNGLK